MIKFFLWTSLIFCAQFSFSGSQPLYSITAITALPRHVASNQSATAEFIVKNNTNRTKTLVMQPIMGVSMQTTTSGSCKYPIVLGSKQSCILNLVINGAQIPNTISTGPIVCQVFGNTLNPNPALCAQPSAAERFLITKTIAANLNQNAWISVLLAQSEPPADYKTYVSQIYALAPQAEQIHIRVSPILNPTTDPTSNSQYQFFANVIAALRAQYATNPNFQIGYHVDNSHGSEPYWGCTSGDWQCVLTNSIIVLNDINALADPDKIGVGFNIYSIEQSYVIPVDPTSVSNVKACLSPGLGGTCPISTFASPSVKYGDVLPSYGSSDIYGPNAFDYGYPQYYNLVESLTSEHGSILITNAEDSYFPPDSAANCISGSYPYNVIDANLTGGPIPLNTPRPPLIPCFDPNVPTTPYPNPANDVFTQGNVANPSLAAAYDAYLMSQLPPISTQIDTNGSTVYITFSGEPEFFGGTGWTYANINSFNQILNTNFTRLNQLIPGIIPTNANTSQIKYAIWNFDQILANNN